MTSENRTTENLRKQWFVLMHWCLYARDMECVAHLSYNLWWVRNCGDQLSVCWVIPSSMLDLLYCWKECLVKRSNGDVESCFFVFNVVLLERMKDTPF